MVFNMLYFAVCNLISKNYYPFNIICIFVCIRINHFIIYLKVKQKPMSYTFAVVSVGLLFSILIFFFFIIDMYMLSLAFLVFHMGLPWWLRQ